MGIYYYAIDKRENKYFSPPDNFAVGYPGVCHPANPFPGMVVMKNCQGYNFEIWNDGWNDIPPEKGWEDVTQKVYKEYIDLFL